MLCFGHDVVDLTCSFTLWGDPYCSTAWLMIESCADCERNEVVDSTELLQVEASHVSLAKSISRLPRYL